MKILVVDDSSIMRRIIGKELRDEGHEIIEAKNGLEAFEKARDIHPSLITMDVDMPEMNGFDAVYKIRNELNLRSAEEDREIPIIFITANDTLEGRRKGFSVGATDFIIKPFLKGEVAACVNNLLIKQNAFEGETALIVEDSRITRNIVDSIIKGKGIHTILASNGREAYELFKAKEQQIDIVVTDYMMPEMDGDELCSKIRFELGNKSVPILILSAMAESTSILKMFKSGASDYVVKPFAKEELLARVGVHLESRRLYKKLTSQIHELKRLNKLKDDFVSVTSHDLRSPLNGILGFAELLLLEADLSTENKQYLHHIKDSGDFLLSLINDILDLGRIQSEDHELELLPLSIVELIESSINTARHMATSKSIELYFDNRCKSTPPRIMGDKNALIRVINNLLSNAIKFTGKNGRVKLTLEEEQPSKLRLTVIDNGIGIPADDIPKLFDRYTAASRSGTAEEKSTGLGLSIAKELIDRHNGTIKVSSQEGKGTVFTIEFPLLAESDVASFGVNSIAESNTPEVFSHLKILIADDNQLNAKLASTILSKKGYSVAAVADGKQAFDYYTQFIETRNGRLDCILMDLKMPVLDGFESARAIRDYEKKNDLPQIPIIAMTAGTDASWRNKAMETGLNGYITKPIRIDQIEAAIRRFIHIDKDVSLPEE